MNLFTATVIRWVLLAPVLLMSAALSGLGWIGLGFGAGWFVLGHLLSFPAFFLNFISAKWGIIGAGFIVLLDAIPRWIVTWPNFSPIDLLSSKADTMILINFALTVAAGLVLLFARKPVAIPE